MENSVTICKNWIHFCACGYLITEFYTFGEHLFTFLKGKSFKIYENGWTVYKNSKKP